MMVVLALLFGLAGGAFWYVSRNPAPLAANWPEVVQRAIENQDFETAYSTLLRVRDQRPDDSAVIRTLAEVCVLRGELDEAVAWLERIPDTQPMLAADARFRAAQCSMRLYRRIQTQDFLREALERNPRLGDARRMLANLEVSFLRPREMREQIVRLDVQGQVTVQDVLLFCGGDNIRYDSVESIKKLEAFTQANPRDGVARAALAYFYLTRSARKQAEETLRLEPMSAEGGDLWRLDLGRAELLIDEGRYQEAAQRLEQLPPAADTLARTWLARGRAWRELGRNEAAHTAFSNACLVDPFDPDAFYSLARLLERDGRSEEARSPLERAKQLQHLVELVEYALNTEKGAVAPKTILEIAHQLRIVGRRREAYLCYRSLLEDADSGYAARQALESLEQEASAIPPVLQIAQPDELAAVTISSASVSPAEARPRLRGDFHFENRRYELRDVAADVGLTFSYFSGGTSKKLLLETLGGGVAVLDYDGDGWPDLFFAQGQSLSTEETHRPPALFRNQDGERFVDVVGSSGIATRGAYGHGVAVGDYDNDGFPDLFVCNYGPDLLFRNNGDGTFTEVTGAAGIRGDRWSTSAAFSDLDGDGDLDLYVATYVDLPLDKMPSCVRENDQPACGPGNYPAAPDVLWENLGNGRFRDAAESAGIDAPDGKGLGVIIADYENHGVPGIFVGNDTTANFFFRNDRPDAQPGRQPLAFSERATLAGCAVDANGRPEACMGIAGGDVDDDGLFDLLVTNFEHETNTFYRNLGKATFTDATAVFGLADAAPQIMGWGAQFFDIEADGDLDLFITNGHLHDEPMQPQLYLNQEKRRFIDVSPQAGTVFQQLRLGRCVALIDWNRDLLADLAVTDKQVPAGLLQNVSNAGHRIALTLVGTESNRDAVGARVTATISGRKRYRQVVGGGGYLAANERTIFLGLGESEQIERLRIDWPRGRTEMLNGIPQGTAVIAIEGGPSVATLAAGAHE